MGTTAAVAIGMPPFPPKRAWNMGMGMGIGVGMQVLSLARGGGGRCLDRSFLDQRRADLELWLQQLLGRPGCYEECEPAMCRVLDIGRARRTGVPVRTDLRALRMPSECIVCEFAAPATHDRIQGLQRLKPQVRQMAA